jgi:hypothetical protein
MSTIIQHKHESTPNNASLIKHDVENPVSSRITALDMVGLTWIFKKDEELLEEFK